ncbi:MAG: hypothetical protein COA50_16555 [Flavobacteriaceae bacterium]|nr:MAG: hypothetical protein COA50_16555 [Flavobacteriaceae bacterium]
MIAYHGDFVVTFFDAQYYSDKTYKKEDAKASLALCSRSNLNVIVLLSKKSDGDSSKSRLKDYVKFKMEGSGTKLLFNTYQLNVYLIKKVTYSVSRKK